MKGIVFTEFLEMVENAHGADTTDELLDLPELASGGAYTSVGTYEFEELSCMVVKLSELLDVPVDSLLRDYGEHLFSCFVTGFPAMFDGQDDCRQFLLGVHDRIHVEVRKLYPEAELPAFDCKIDGDELVMNYQSSRPLARFAEGLIHGCLKHFGEQSEVTCTLTGDRTGHEAQFRIK
jgi:predicted hydrocarbon binding protein